jgi:RNA polymerase sigma-70 factor (ECF subfamily)
MRIGTRETINQPVGAAGVSKRALARTSSVVQSTESSQCGRPAVSTRGTRLTSEKAIDHSSPTARATSVGPPVERAMSPNASAATRPLAVDAGDGGPRSLDDLMARYARGENAALDELYRLGAPRVRGFLTRLCGDLALAEDLTQDAFLRVCSARGTFAAGASALPWMLAIARNAFRDHVRRENVRRAHREESGLLARVESVKVLENVGDRTLIARQTLGVVQRALMKLPVRQREAFVLLRFEGIGLEQAADVLGATRGAVKILVHRAYTAIREACDNDENDRAQPTPPPAARS